MYQLSDEQIDDMKHAIGFSGDRVKGRTHRVYDAYRNYYTTCGDHEGWDNLLSQGLAEKRDFPAGGANSKIYFVSDSGLKFLGKLLDVKITERK